MSARMRSVLGAVALAGGLLLIVGGSVYKSIEDLRYQRDVERQKADPEPARHGGANLSMLLGALTALGGGAMLAISLRELARQIGVAQERSEAALRNEMMARRDPPPKP